MRLDYFPLPAGPITPAHDPNRNVLGGWLVTSYFGGRKDPITGVPGNHGGMDLAGSGVAGAAIIAPVAGAVSQGWDPTGGGNWTSLVTPDGHRFGFGHAASFAPGVNGTTVKAGTVLGYVGTTGHSTGAHLHFAYGAPGVAGWSDPYDLLVDVSARANGSVPGPVPGTPDPSPIPSTNVKGAELVAILYFADKPNRWVLGIDRSGWFCWAIPGEQDLAQLGGLPVRQLAAGDDWLDSTFHACTGQ